MEFVETGEEWKLVTLTERETLALVHDRPGRCLRFVNESWIAPYLDEMCRKGLVAIEPAVAKTELNVWLTELGKTCLRQLRDLGAIT